MKRNNIIVYLFSGVTLFSACHDLDLNPLSNGSTENWYSNETEIEMAVNELYRDTFWPLDEEGNTDWSDDKIYRENLTPFQNATLNGQTDKVKDLWSKQYKVVSRANSIILKADRAIEAGAMESKINAYVAEARFHRACAYAKMSSKYGDVPLVVDDVDIDNRGFGTYAYASSSDFSITLQMDADKDYDQKGTVSHELTHIFDFAHANYYTYYGISDSYEWQRLHEMAPGSLGEYGRDDTAEFFADAGEMYINYPDELKEANMDIYNFMNNLYQMY
mgnify:CR=1 FL=1